MASRYEVEVTITSAKDLKNVNWRHGPLRPYAVVWVDPKSKCSTRVDEQGDDSPHWDQKLVIPLNDYSVHDAVLHVDVVHADAAEDTKSLIGSARLPLRQVVDEVGFGEFFTKKLPLERPSGRPHGKITLQILVRELRYRAPDPYYAQPAAYGVSSGSRDYYAPPPPQQYGYTNAPPPYQPVGYQSYGQPSYGQGGGYGYGQPEPVVEEKKKSKFGGMGTGLAVGAVAGVLGGLAIAEGVDYVEDKIAEDAAEKVEDDLGYDDNDGGDDEW